MRDDAKRQRQEQIEVAAYAVLEEKGYGGTSMLAIARRARASNETLYNWYGDKLGLFLALVARNAGEVRALLEARVAAQADPLATLREVGPMLLSVVTGPRAVALNRAAAADPSGDLGRAIVAAGRDTIAPLVGEVLIQARNEGAIGGVDSEPEAALDLFLSLLIGDVQIRCVVGRAPAPSEANCIERTDRAIDALLRLMPPDAAPASEVRQGRGGAGGR